MSKKLFLTVFCGLMSLPFSLLAILIFLEVYSLAPRMTIAYLAVADQGLLLVCAIAAILVGLGYNSYHKPPYWSWKTVQKRIVLQPSTPFGHRASDDGLKAVGLLPQEENSEE